MGCLVTGRRDGAVGQGDVCQAGWRWGWFLRLFEVQGWIKTCEGRELSLEEFGHMLAIGRLGKPVNETDYHRGFAREQFVMLYSDDRWQIHMERRFDVFTHHPMICESKPT